MARVAALFTRADSVYRSLGADCYDADRDARTFDLSCPVVAHPPCRAWASLRHGAKPRPDEKDLAYFAVWAVRHCGGVLEHPQCTTLWRSAGLPEPGHGRDPFGGFSLSVDQFWFGHLAKKATRLYIVGPAPRDLPTLPFALGDAPCTVGLWSGRDRVRARPSIAKREYEATPLELAAWLLDCARLAA